MNSRFRIFFLASTLLVVGASFTRAQAPVRLGVRGGLNVANAAVNDPPAGSTLTSSRRTGASVGLGLELNLPGPFSILSELRYTEKGAIHQTTSVVDGVQTSAKVTGNINYFDLPLLLQVRFSKGPLTPYLFAGPTLGILISAHLDTELDGESWTDDVRDQTEPAELGVDFGGGLELKLFARSSIVADIRYSLGFTNIAKRQDAFDPSSWKSRDIKILVGMMFDL